MSKLIDVTVPVSDAVATFPVDRRFQMDFMKPISEADPAAGPGSPWGSHAGTHVDAPFHFTRAGSTGDRLSLDVMIGRAQAVLRQRP